MCNHYLTPDDAAIERYWALGPRNTWRGGDVFPRKPGPFIRAGTYGLELVVGQWGLVPWFAKSRTLTYSTNNARFEGIESKASYKLPWSSGQRCIIPAKVFLEPNWESGKNEWWTFARADGDLWSLAGLWNAWTDKATGEIVETYTMLTLNADSHPLMRRMHKPDPKLGPDQQDKRSVVPIEREDVAQWLEGTSAEASALMRLASIESFIAGPAPR